MSSKYLHCLQGLVPVADAFAGTKYTDIFNFQNADEMEFLIFKGAGDTGTSTVTVEACDDVSASNTEAITFHYQSNTATDVFSDETAATTAGFTTTAGANQIYKIIVRKNDIKSTGYGFVRLKLVEVADDPVTACVLAIADCLRFDTPIQPKSFLS